MDPSFNLLSVRASLRAGSKDVLRIKGAFSNGDVLPDTAPEVTVTVGTFTLKFPSGQFTRRNDRYKYSQKVLGRRKVTVDFAKGTFTVSLAGVELGPYEKGSVPVTVSIEFESVRFRDTPLMTGNGKSLRY